jgi:transcriptional regulator with XRE-family HTH domain
MQPIARGRRLRVLLEVLEWSQKRLSEQTGITTSDLNKMLTGEKKGGIDPINAWRIASALGVTEIYILYGNRQGLPPELLRLLPPED